MRGTLGRLKQPPGSGSRVLLVCASRHGAAAHIEALSEDGHVVSCAANHAQAVLMMCASMLRGDAMPDVVIADERDGGFHLLEEIARSGLGVPVRVLLRADDSMCSSEPFGTSAALGPNCDPDDLRTAVYYLLNRPSHFRLRADTPAEASA